MPALRSYVQNLNVASVAAGQPGEPLRGRATSDDLRICGYQLGDLHLQQNKQLQLCLSHGNPNKCNLVVASSDRSNVYRMCSCHVSGRSSPGKGVFMLAGKNQPPKLIAIRMNVGSSIMLALK